MFSAPYGNCHSAVFGATYDNCQFEVFSAPYVHFQSAVFSAPYGRSAILMNVPCPRTASHQTDAAASHSCHFNTVLYPRSYSECQLTLNRSRRYIPGAAFSV